MKNSNFKIGQTINYTQCLSFYTGIIVKIKNKSLVVIDDKAGMELYKSGCACGSEISFNQVK